MPRQLENYLTKMGWNCTWYLKTKIPCCFSGKRLTIRIIRFLMFQLKLNGPRSHLKMARGEDMSFTMAPRIFHNPQDRLPCHLKYRKLKFLIQQDRCYPRRNSRVNSTNYIRNLLEYLDKYNDYSKNHFQ